MDGETTLALADEQFKFTPTGLAINGEPDFETWETVGKQLRYREGAIHWWIGDWLNYGEQRWGEMYAQAIDEFDFTRGTLRNDKWVAGKILSHVRHDKLTFSHHLEVAPLPSDIQERWLDIAEQEGLTPRELRKCIKRNPSGIIEPVLELPPTIINQVELHHADSVKFLPTLADASIDVIITDPPYPREFIHLYRVLAEQAARVLKPGSSLLAMCGQSYFGEVLQQMTPYLKYNWLICYLTPGVSPPKIWPRKVNTFWKPVVWLIKGEYDGDWHGDVIKSDVNDNDKRYHEWGQSESGIIRLVETFSKPDDLILDPFCGGCTVGLAALSLGRRFIGV